MRSRMRCGTALVGVALLISGLSAGGAAAVPGGKKLGKIAAKQCAMERKALGPAQFRAAYGKPAMPRCIGVNRPEVREAFRNAARECRAERAEIGVQAFREKYGANRNKRNAFGKCVAGKRKQELREDRRDVRNAARDCRAERSDPDFADSHEGKSFSEFYGRNKNAKNAFGKCVSGKTRATDEEPPAA